jgi:hypothetical protein
MSQRLQLSKIRRAARQLLTLDDKSPRRIFEGNALIRRLVRVGKYNIFILFKLYLIKSNN